MNALVADRKAAVRRRAYQRPLVRIVTPARDVVLIDAPGHAEFLRNRVAGAKGASP